LKFVLFTSRSWEICVNVSLDKNLVCGRSKEREGAGGGLGRYRRYRRDRREKQGHRKDW
jgi:hypothetical protein